MVDILKEMVKNMSKPTTYIYWIKTPDMKNIWRQGYVGRTNDIERRQGEYKANTGNRLINEKITEIGWNNLVFKVIHFTTEAQAQALEQEYRHRPNIGWNEATGGGPLGRKWLEKFPLQYSIGDLMTGRHPLSRNK